MHSPKISVIVPVYNVEFYIRKCIDSILVQSYTNFELLLIDDGSTDGSGKICDEYAEKDDRIRVFHKPNSGVSTTRNIGIEKATGYYVAFIDSDDWIEKDYLIKLLPNGDELVICSLFWEEAQHSVQDRLSENHYRSDELIHFIEDNITSQMFVGPFCKLFVTSLLKVHDIKFVEKLHHCEDFIFVLDYIISIKPNIKTIEETLYHYRRNLLYSLSVKSLSSEHCVFFLDLLYSKIYKIYSEFGFKKIPTFIFREHLANCFANIIKNILYSPVNILHKIKKIRQLLNDERFRNILLDETYIFREGKRNYKKRLLFIGLKIYYWPHHFIEEIYL